MIDDRSIARLREIADIPDLSGTRYRAIRRLGQGGMGTVHLVEDVEMGREVALKVLTVPDAGGALAARLRSEARLLAGLEHPNIVPVHDLGTLPDGRVFYVMKYVRGDRLDAWRREGRARPETLRLFLKICEAVAFAHARGVIHRDLKPENVMVGSFGEALVMDWGVAKILAGRLKEHPTLGESVAEAPAGTEHGTLLGTPAYMAPEQARGDVRLIDERTDVHALGAILYFLLSDRPPVSAADGGEALRQAREGIRRPLREIDPGIPRDLEAICEKAMAAEPEGRYPGARELSEEVDRFLEGLPVAARPVGILEKGVRFLGRNRLLASLILAYLVMRVLVLVFTRR
jgi:eukaryotic-like serine/threonine-protein kinase